MSIHDLTFVAVATSDTIYDPLAVSSTYVDIQVTNNGTDDLEDLGLYIVSATSVGDVDNPSDNPPETDYQDLIEWGEATDLALAVQGGLKVDVPQNGGGTLEAYITRTAGSLKSNKIPFIDLGSGDTQTFSVLIETPPSVSARRFYVDLVLE